jgi:hypothetical protein
MTAELPPALVGALLAARAPALDDARRTALLGCPRVGERVRAAVVGGVAPIPPMLDQAAAARAVLLAGAGLHAGAVLGLLRGADLALLVDELGLDPRPAALACVTLTRGVPARLGDATLHAAIRADGAACLAGWVLAQRPEAALVQWRALPDAARAAAPHPDGPAVVGRLLAEQLL